MCHLAPINLYDIQSSIVYFLSSCLDYMYKESQLRLRDICLAILPVSFLKTYCNIMIWWKIALGNSGYGAHIDGLVQDCSNPTVNLSPDRRQAIIRTNAGILLIEPLWTNFSEISIEIHTFSFKEMHLKMSSGKWRPFCLGPNVLTHWTYCSLTLSHRYVLTLQWLSKNGYMQSWWLQPEPWV